MSTPAAVEMEGVAFGYNGLPVLEDVSFRVEQGQFVGLVGPNGGGKTTLLRLMLGLISPQRGWVRLLGQPPRRARRRVGYLPQHAQLDPRFPVTVLEVVLMGRLGLASPAGTYRRQDRQAALAALEQCGLAGLAKRPLAALSGGQRQRALIARALVADPELLILDEPASHVDLVGEQELYDLLEGLIPRVTVLLATHDLAFVTQHISEVVCVNRTVRTHPTCGISGELIHELYGHPVRLVRHDHNHAPEAG